MVELRKAQKSQSKLRIGISGTAGSGKTFSALKLAYGLTGAWEDIAIIDTENGSADLYSHLGGYNVITLTAPFSPERYIEAMQACESAGIKVIIIDSITHEWDGSGGILQIHEQMGGNSFTAWGKLTPRHNTFVQAILQSSAHVITTVRRKQDYAMENVDGKTKVTKQGLKEITREGFEYELTLSFALEQNHLASASKDRTGLFMDKPAFIIDENTGRALKAWADGGKPVTVLADVAQVKLEDQEKMVKEYKKPITITNQDDFVPINKRKAVPAQVEDEPDEPEEAEFGICEEHDIPWTEYKRNGKTWYSHKKDNGEWHNKPSETTLKAMAETKAKLHIPMDEDVQVDQIPF